MPKQKNWQKKFVDELKPKTTYIKLRKTNQIMKNIIIQYKQS